MSILRAVWPPLLILGAGLALSCLSLLALPIVLLGALDTFGRARDYIDLNRRYINQPPGYLPIHIINYYGRSYCGRNVILTIHPEWHHYYCSVGYRWYHFLPDGFPAVLLRRAFWRNLFLGHRV